MRSLHRAAVGGGIAALAIAAAAGSSAFACTPQARLCQTNGYCPTGSAAGGAYVEGAPGATVSLTVSGFAPEPMYGHPEFHWNTTDGPLLAVAGEPSSSTENGGLVRATWIIELQLPPSATGDGNVIQGTQADNLGQPHIANSLPVRITGGAPQSNAGGGGGGGGGGDQTITALPPTTVASTTASTVAPAAHPKPSAPTSARPGPGAPAPAATTSGGSSGPSQAPSSKAGAPSAPGTPAGPAGSAAPATTAAGGSTSPSQPLPVPDAQVLWNGLQGSTSALSLLDAPVPASSGSGFPAGAALLGLGLLALGGTGAITAQRRLALAKAVRR